MPSLNQGNTPNSTTKDQQREVIRAQRKQLIKELEMTYLRTFDRLTTLDLNEGNLAKLTQLILNSKEAAIQTLEQEIEAPLITQAPKNTD